MPSLATTGTDLIKASDDAQQKSSRLYLAVGAFMLASLFTKFVVTSGVFSIDEVQTYARTFLLGTILVRAEDAVFARLNLDKMNQRACTVFSEEAVKAEVAAQTGSCKL